MRKMAPGLLVILAAVMLWPMHGTCSQNKVDDEPLVYSSFYIKGRPNYKGSRWVFESGTHRLIGYAMWDAVKRRFTVFDLKGRYYGFYQATIQGFYPGFYRQYLKYDKNNRYSYAVMALPGGRPLTAKNRYGELGGQWVLNDKGNITLPDTTPRPSATPLDGLDDLYSPD